MLFRKLKKNTAPSLKAPPKGKYKVAILLPLTGKSASVGKAFLDAAQLALFDLRSPNFTLVPIDTKSSIPGAKSAAKKAVKERAHLILGPVFSNTTRAVAPIARLANIQVISFSNDSSLGGNGIYLLGFRPDQQIRRVIAYASSQGIKDYIALVSNDHYGAMAARVLRNTAKYHQGKVLKEEYYQPHNITTNKNTQRATKSVKKSLNADSSKKGLLIPAGGESLAALSILLDSGKFNKDRVQLIGSGQWDDSTTQSIPFAVGGWYAGISPQRLQQFSQKFHRSFGYNPPRIASLAYDAIALTITLSKIAKGNPFSKRSLTNSRGFLGINGIFRLHNTGLSERGLAVLEITRNGSNRVISPAPTSF